MRKLLLILIALVGGIQSHSQASDKDSLFKVLQSAKDDTAKVFLLLNITNLYSSKNYDSFYFYLNEASALSKRLKSDKYDFYINTCFAEYYYYKNNAKDAVAYGLASKTIAEEQNDLKLLAKAYNNLAAVYNHFSQPRSAIECILKCLDISEKTKDSISFPVRNLTASNTYYNLRQYDKTIEYAKKAVKYGTQFNNPFVIAMGLNNLSTGYSGLYMLDSSIAISKRQLAFAREQEDIVNINYALINLCSNNFQVGNFAALEVYAKELAENAKKFPDEKKGGEINNSLAMAFIAQQKYDLAKAQLDSGINSAIDEENADALGNLYKTYSVLYYRQGNIKEAERHFYKYDSVIQAGNLQELNYYAEELETKYDTEKKEAQIKLQQAQLRQKNILNYFLIGGGIALLTILLLIYRNYRNRQKLQQAKIDELETEKQLTATEAVLKGEEQERTRLAKDLHDGLGGMLSGVKHSLSNIKGNLIMTPDNARAFERSIDMLNSSISEMRRVAHNMMPEILLKYGLNTALREFCNEIQRSGAIHVNYQPIGMDTTAIDQTTAVTIYRIVQELVNNAIKHAKAKNVLVQAHVSEQEQLLSITVEDDGKGFDTSILKQSPGIGWSNIQNRIEFLKGEIDVNSEPGKGTSVLIEITIDRPHQ